MFILSRKYYVLSFCRFKALKILLKIEKSLLDKSKQYFEYTDKEIFSISLCYFGQHPVLKTRASLTKFFPSYEYVSDRFSAKFGTQYHFLSFKDLRPMIYEPKTDKQTDVVCPTSKSGKVLLILRKHIGKYK